MGRKFTKTAAVLAAAAALCTGCIIKDNNSGKSGNTEPVPVRVITVHETETFSGTNYVGRVEPSKNTVVMSEFPGTLEELNVTRGRRIRKGDVIARISSEPLQSAYDIAKSTLAQAEDGYERASKVYGSGSVTDVKMVEIQTRLEQARAAEKSARSALDNCVITAPFNGVIGEIYAHTGEHVTAAAALVQILDVESLEIHFSVPENEYASLPVGTAAEVEIPALRKTIGAAVAVKGITASPLSHAYDFTLKGLSDPSSLMPGMVCKVRVRSTDNTCIVIPATAVMTDMNGRYIWGVSSDDTVCKTYVTVGGYADKGVIISEGLSAGDRIIVEGARKVSTGMKVKAEE